MSSTGSNTVGIADINQDFEGTPVRGDEKPRLVPIANGEKSSRPTRQQEAVFSQLTDLIGGKRSAISEPVLHAPSLYRFRPVYDEKRELEHRAMNPLNGFEMVAKASGVNLYEAYPYPFTNYRTVDRALQVGVDFKGLSQGEVRIEPTPSSFRTNMNGLERVHGDNLVEWWENKPVGVEHGYLIQMPLDQKQTHADIRIELEFETPFAAEGDLNGEALVFKTDDGQRAMTYDKLLVTDAGGKELEARMEYGSISDGVDGYSRVELTLVVETNGAQYPILVDPLITSQLVADINSVIEGVEEDSAAVIGDKLLFSAFSERSGFELWVSDGSESGTKLLKDLYPGRSSSFPMEFFSTDSKAFFTAYSDGKPNLLCSDGTELGTVVFAESSMDSKTSGFVQMDLLEERLYYLDYQFNDGNYSAGFWLSDGTPQGTELIGEFDWNDQNPSWNPPVLVKVGDLVFFSAPVADGSEFVESLWCFDINSPKETLLNLGIDNGFMEPNELTPLEDRLIFSAHSEATGKELWISDGTVDGTRLLKDIIDGSYSGSPRKFAAFDDRLFFVAQDGVDPWLKLWATDGTEGGTQIVSEVRIALGSAYSEQFFVAGGFLYFPAIDWTDETDFGIELWRSDGTQLGTTIVRDIYEGGNSSHPELLLAVGDQLYFRAIGTVDSNEIGIELWKSDAAGATLVKDLHEGEGNSFSEKFLELGGELYFMAKSFTESGGSKYGLWKSIESSEGVVPLSTIDTRFESASLAGREFGTKFVKANGDAFVFLGVDGEGPGLWLFENENHVFSKISDLNIRTRWMASQVELIRLGNEILFTGYTDGEGGELWKTDGSALGTELVKDIFLGSEGSLPQHPVELNGVAYFIAQGSNGIEDFGFELWKSDGTEEGTVMVKDIWPGEVGGVDPRELIAWNDDLYFFASTEDYGHELWKSDGIEAGTVLVKDIFLGTLGSNGNLRDIAEFDGKLFFSATGHDGSTTAGQELWSTDGTENGTVIVKDINPGEMGSTPRHLTTVADALYFSASGPDGVGDPLGVELWKSDGTETGTVLVKDISLGSGDSYPEWLFEYGGELLFAAEGYDGVEYSGQELWKSDGTAGGTEMVKDISPGNVNSFPSRFIELNGTVFFSARHIDGDDSFGNELWRTDGTTDGTYLVRDIKSGESSSDPYGFNVVGGAIYFSAENDLQGRELWKTDGTSGGTVLVEDLNFGLNYSEPNYLGSIGSMYYYSASNGQSGAELRVLDTTPRALPPLPELQSFRLDDGQFEIRYLTENGFVYQIERAFLLSPQIWEGVGPVVFGDGEVVEYTADPRFEWDRFFYRVAVAWPQPTLEELQP